MMSPEDAIVAVAKDILADPLWAARVVCAALVAETQLPYGHPARETLNWATTHPPTTEDEIRMMTGEDP